MVLVVLTCVLLVVNEVAYLLVCLLAMSFAFSMCWLFLKHRPQCCATQDKTPVPSAAAQALAKGTASPALGTAAAEEIPLTRDLSPLP